MAATDPRSIVARLAVAVMASDGRITTTEMEIVSHLDSLGLGDLSGPVREQIQVAMREPIDPVAVCDELTPLSREAAATIVAALAEIALADRALTRRESQVLFLIARALGLDDAETEHLVRGSLVAHGAELRPDADAPAAHPAAAGPAAPQPRHATPAAADAAPPPAPPRTAPAAPAQRATEPPPRAPSPAPERPAAPGGPEQLHVRERPADGFDLDRARTLLGVGPTATRADVDAAYLRLVAFYDPAKVMDLGPEFVVLSVRRLGQATTAYQIAVGAVP